MSRLRLLHLTAGNLYGGIETYLVTLARCRHDSNMDPHYGLCFPGRLRNELLASDVPTHDVGPVRLSRPWTTWRARRRLKTLLRKYHFDAVLTHASWPHAVFAPTVRRAGVFLANVVHDYLIRPSLIDRHASKTPPDLVIANSRFTATAAAKLFPSTRVEVVYLPVAAPTLGVRDSVRREVRTEMGTDPNTVVILQASRLEVWKGHAVHLDALVRLTSVSGWEAWFAGGPQKTGEESYLAILRNKVEQSGLGSRIRFLGQRSDVPRLMAAADVYCQPNTGPEPFGMVYVEALHAELPVVASGFGGAVEIVDETCGVLTPPGDSAAVAAALHDLIQNRDRRLALGAKCMQRAMELCHPEQQLNKLSTILSTSEVSK